MALMIGGVPERLLGVRSRGLSGRVALQEGAAGFESSLEQDLIELLDFDSRVSELLVQPFSLYHEEDGKKRRYTPDVRATFIGDRPEVVVYEVKYQEELRADWAKLRARFGAAYRHCRQNGWRFKVLTEKHIRTPYLGNVKFLRRFFRLPEQELISGQLFYTLKATGPTTVQALLSATYQSSESRLRAIPTLWKMVADGRVGCDLTVTLTMASTIWMES